MKLSLKDDSKEWFQFIRRAVSRTTWKEDLLRGLKILQTGGVLIADRSFAETELFRLRRRIDQADEKLAQAFQSLGKRSMDHWESQQVLDEKEKIRAFKQIDALKKERQEIFEKMEMLKSSSHHSLHDKPPSSSPSHDEPPPTPSP